MIVAVNKLWYYQEFTAEGLSMWSGVELLSGISLCPRRSLCYTETEIFPSNRSPHESEKFDAVTSYCGMILQIFSFQNIGKSFAPFLPSITTSSERH